MSLYIQQTRNTKWFFKNWKDVFESTDTTKHWLKLYNKGHFT